MYWVFLLSNSNQFWLLPGPGASSVPFSRYVGVARLGVRIPVASGPGWVRGLGDLELFPRSPQQQPLFFVYVGVSYSSGPRLRGNLWLFLRLSG